MAEYEVAIHGVSAKVTVAEPGIFSGARLLVDGRSMERIRFGRYRLPKADGSTTELRVVGSFGQYLPVLIVDGVTYQVGPKLPTLLVVLSFLPFVLVFVGGALGGLCGAVGWAFNNQIARTAMPTTVKVVVMSVVTVASVGAFAVAAGLFQLAIGNQSQAP